jgi:glutamate-1-semialdehyde 2,1-aminomutase
LEPEHNERAREIFFANTAANGLLLHPSHHWYVSAAHSPADIEQTIAICEAAVRTVLREL